MQIYAGLLFAFFILSQFMFIFGSLVLKQKRNPETGNATDSEENPLVPRIIGGQTIGQGAIPYQLYYSYKGNIECGATLAEVYGIQIAITASHCLWIGYPDRDSYQEAKYIEVTAGDRRLSDYNHREQERKVTKVVAYPDYDPKHFTHDISLLILNQPFKESPWVEPILLPTHDRPLPPTIRISGWGSEIYGEDLQNDLRWATIPVLPENICLAYNALLTKPEITTNQFCAGQIGGPRLGSCSGDSGGPAVTYDQEADSNVLIGIISFGITSICGNPFFPTVFTQVSKYVDWIRIQVSKYKDESGV